MLTDFGLSRMYHYSTTFLWSTQNEQTKGSTRWMAFELFYPMDQAELSDATESSEGEEDLGSDLGLVNGSRSDSISSPHIDMKQGDIAAENPDLIQGLPTNNFALTHNDSSGGVFKGLLHQGMKGSNGDIEDGREEDSEREEDVSDEFVSIHTKMSDMWAFGMVIYVS